jgi:N-acetylneuraminate lyase
MTAFRPLHEFVAATHSPFHEDGSLAPEVVRAQAAFLAANGVRTVFVTGTTGECHSMTCAERLALFDAWAEAAPAHDMRVVAHVGSHALDDACAMARRAHALGLAAISALAPSYYKPATLGDLIAWCADIAAEAPGIPFYYYEIPSMTGLDFPVERFLAEAPARIPTLAGVKFTNSDLVSYRRSLDVAAGRFDLPFGMDEMLLGALATGARGGVGSTYNLAHRLYVELRAAFERGDLESARRLQSRSVAMVDAIAAPRCGFMGTAKALMTRLGVPVGPARAPFGNPTPADVDGVMARLEALGFREWGAAAPERAR